MAALFFALIHEHGYGRLGIEALVANDDSIIHCSTTQCLCKSLTVYNSVSNSKEKDRHVVGPTIIYS